MHVFLSYPKSGRTWLRFMVDSYLCRLRSTSPSNVFAVEREARGTNAHIEWTHLTGAMRLRLPYWEIESVSIERFADASWIFLARNFEATLRSAYFQATERLRIFDGSPSAFLTDPRYGALKLVSFYNLWTERVRPSVKARASLAYESILADPTGELRRLLQVLDLPLNDDWITEVVAGATLDRMRQLSLAPAYRGTVLAPADPTRPESYKVRAGAGNAGLFSDDDVAYIDEIVDKLFVARHDPTFALCCGRPPSQSSVHATSPDTD